MKISNIKIEKFSAKLEEPFRVAFGVIETADTWSVKVETDAGIWGIGSAAPLPFVTGESIETCHCVLKEFAAALIGHDPLDIAGAHALMDAMYHGNGSAKCAIDLALYDIAGKAQGLPVYKLLGGTDPVVVSDITIGIDTPEKMEAYARDYVFNKGFRILKVKIGNDLAHDLDALGRIRKAVGKDVRIRIDANQGYTVETALKCLPEFEKLGIDAAEQFRPWWDFDGSAEIKRKNTSACKIMLDESIHDVFDAKRAAEGKCADYFNIKLMKCGGLYYGAKIADIAAEHGVKCMVGCMSENKISIAAAVALVAAKPAIVEADCDSFLLYKGGDDGLTGGFTREGGIYTLTEKPGLGVDYDF
ncbi:MAG: dipeptide epimerase [Clostridia bacterium]|nr:dipeptide epimerase [Clostridia bacterium]